MTVKTTLSFTDRHHRFLTEKVADGVFATASAAVAAAVERMIEDEAERSVALSAMAEAIRARMATGTDDFFEMETVFAALRAAEAPPRG